MIAALIVLGWLLCSFVAYRLYVAAWLHNYPLTVPTRRLLILLSALGPHHPGDVPMHLPAGVAHPTPDATAGGCIDHTLQFEVAVIMGTRGEAPREPAAQAPHPITSP
jgi:hypothetical protein